MNQGFDFKIATSDIYTLNYTEFEADIRFQRLLAEVDRINIECKLKPACLY